MYNADIDTFAKSVLLYFPILMNRNPGHRQACRGSFESGGAKFFWSRDMTNIDFSIANKIRLGEATAEPKKIFQFSG